MAKALSQAQHEFMGAVKQFKLTGQIPAGADWDRQERIRATAGRMSHEQLDDYLTTKTDKLPDHVGD